MITDARKRANKKWNDAQDEFRIRVPQGKKALIQAHAESKRLSLNAYIVGLIDADMGKKWKEECIVA